MYLSGEGALPNPLYTDPKPPVDRPGVCPPHWIQTPQMQTPLDVDPFGHVTRDACWEVNHPVDIMTDTCENITLPKTSSACGKKSTTPQGKNMKYFRQ